MKKNITSFLLSILLFSNAQAQADKIERKELNAFSFEQHINHVRAQEITLGANQTAPTHFHPCPVIGYIKSGKILFQLEGEEPIILNAGDSFYEPKDKHVLHFDNASIDQPATFIAFYLIENIEETTVIVK